MTPISEIAKGTTQAIFGKGVELIDNLTLSKEEKVQKKLEWQELLNNHITDLRAAELLIEKELNEDRKLAREFALAQMNSKDWLGRNFVHLLSGFTIFFTFCFGVALAFIPVPMENKSLVDMFFGTLLIASSLGIYNFYIGSSKNSRDKTDIMAQQQAGGIDKYLEGRKERRVRLRKNKE